MQSALVTLALTCLTSYSIIMVALCNKADNYIFALWFLSFFLFFLALSRRSEIGCLPYIDTWCDLSANLECMSEMCCTWLAENTGSKKSPYWHHGTTLSGCIFAAEACSWGMYRQLRKKLVKHRYDTSSTCPHNMVNFILLMAEICWQVWGTPANFNSFRVLATLLHGTLVVGVSQTLHDAYPSHGLVHYIYIPEGFVP